MISVEYVASFLLVVIGLWGMLNNTHVIKILVSLSVIEGGVNLFLVSLGYMHGPGQSIPTAPIYTGFRGGVMVSPLPQALVVTSIVIGVSIISLALAISIKVYEHYGTLDVREIRRLRG